MTTVTNDIATKILDYLKNTQYNSSSLEKLSGGSANFTFRATLKDETQDGSVTVVVKHAEPYIAANPAWPYDVVRSVSIEKMKHLPMLLLFETYAR